MKYSKKLKSRGRNFLWAEYIKKKHEWKSFEQFCYLLVKAKEYFSN